MEATRLREVVLQPAWRPFTDGDATGYAVLVGIGAVLITLTILAYVGNAAVTSRRLALLIGLRLAALVLAVITTLRPSISITEIPAMPSTLVISMDVSESMTFRDEYDRKSRFEVMRKALETAQPLLDRLSTEQSVTVKTASFADDIADWTPDRKPDGQRSDFGKMLSRLHDTVRGEKNLRGLILLTDGADNGAPGSALVAASKWRASGGPIYPFVLGRTDTRSEKKDLAFTSIEADPSPVSVKTDLKVRGRISAQGLEGSRVTVKLLLDDKPAKADSFVLDKTLDNIVELTVQAPEKPGEVKVSLVIEEGPAGEVSLENNRIDTYVTVIKGGVRVLVIDRLRIELRFFRLAIESDRNRFAVVPIVRQTDAPAGPEEAEKLDLLKQPYDAIVIGDVSPARLKAISPTFLDDLRTVVTEKGVGLMMTGGYDSFGTWANTPIAELLPVTVSPAAQADDPQGVEIVPTAEGLRHFLMRLEPDPAANAAAWALLNERQPTRIGGYTPLGKPKIGATVYANVKSGATITELLVGREVGRGRVLAFGADQTWKWINLGIREGAPDRNEGYKRHAQFWKQLLLWLAHQEEAEGTVYVRPGLRRMARNANNPLEMGVRDVQGRDVPNPEVRYQVIRSNEKPDRTKATVPPRDAKGISKANFTAKDAGEYRVMVWGKGKNPDGSPIEGEATARFVIDPDISEELLRPSANPDFLLGLETAANGIAPVSVRRADQLAAFIEKELLAKPLKAPAGRPKLTPDWRRDGSSWFLPAVLIGFVTLLGLEWGLRRLWGLT